MDQPTRTDPFAVALGNASLLGVGYLLLGRRLYAAVAAAVTVVLVAYTVAVASAWWEVVVLVWWAGTVAHGWFLAGRGAHRDAIRRHRLIALAVTLPVVLVVGLLRFDTASIESDVTAGRDGGDCGRVLAAQHQVWLGNRVADAPLAARGDATVRTCHRLQAARADLRFALANGDTGNLRAGFHTLEVALRDPGNEKIVGTVLNGFLRGLPTKDPCGTAALTDWLRDRRPDRHPLDRSADTVRRTAPAALVGCGDQQMDDENWDTARSRYQQLLDLYPGDERAGRAKDGAELANVSGLLEGGSDERPEYCSHPAKYSRAPAYGGGTNKAMFFGNSSFTDRLPDSWRTGDPAHATLVVCASDEKDGPTTQTCTYQSENTGKYYAVTFHEIAIPVQAYELRTGKRVADRTIEIGGTSCPTHLTSYDYGGIGDTGPDPDQDVRDSDADVRDAFRSLIIR